MYIYLYIEPPDCNAGSDEDSGDKSGGTVNNLSGLHLQASSIRFGYKVWALNSTDGYLIDFEVCREEALKEKILLKQKLVFVRLPL